MTNITIIGGIRMITRFTLRNHPVMTTDTGTNNFSVIQWSNKGCPATGWHAVTGFASIRSIWMTT
jgi:hypothetical protein